MAKKRHFSYFTCWMPFQHLSHRITGSAFKRDLSHYGHLAVTIYRGDATLAYAGKSDEELMLLYQQGEVSAFEELYTRYSPKLYAFLKARTEKPGETEDLLQQVCLKVHQYRYHYNVSLPFVPWLFSITRRTLIDHLRKHQPIIMENTKLQAIADKNAMGGAEAEKANWKELIELLPVEQRKLIRVNPLIMDNLG